MGGPRRATGVLVHRTSGKSQVAIGFLRNIGVQLLLVGGSNDPL